MRKYTKASPPPVASEISSLYSVERMFEEWRRSQGFAAKSANTRRCYEASMRAIAAFDPGLLAARACWITRPEMRELHERLWRARGLSQAQACLSALRAAFSFATARERGAIAVNPCLGLGLQAPPPRLRCASLEEIAALLDAAEVFEPSLGDAIVLALYSGQRQGDILALRWRDVVGGRIALRQGKTGTRVSILILPTVAQRLRRIASRNLARGVEPQTIVARDGRQWNANSFRHRYVALRAVAARQCPGVADFRFQDLRDTAVTWLARAGCTVPEIGSVTGHAFETINGTLKHYLVIDEALNNAAMTKLGAWAGEVVG
jgi:integrase